MEMITMDRDEYGAKPSKIKVGRQVTTEAFKLLAGESGMGALAQETKEGCEEIRNTLDTLTLRTRTNLEKERIKRIEEQLRTLASLKTMPQGRERYLLNRAEIAQRNIEGFEKKIKRLKKKLKGEAEWNFFWT